MSRKKRELIESLQIISAESEVKAATNLPVEEQHGRNRWNRLDKSKRIGFAGLCVFLVVGVFGATGWGTKIINSFTSDSADPNQTTKNNSRPSAVNPATMAMTTGTPRLSKEYIYAGSRMLAVEDAGANVAPPADLAVWRKGNGYWHVMGVVSQQWGSNSAGDKPVQGDYDGDGKTDFCVFRDSAGTWFIIKSSSGSANTQEYYYFGAAGDKPVPADFDGDGRTDAAVYRVTGTSGTWYIRQSSTGNIVSQQFGLNLEVDQPAPADYDGDGKADLGVWRAGDKSFYVLRSTNGQFQAVSLSQAAATGTAPVSADYDGDGKADFAVRGGADWIISYTGLGGAVSQSQTYSGEQAGDIPVQNDYDGDGKVDIAVWRESIGGWYIKNSSTGQLRYEQWGQPADVPVPAFYRR
jgi:hypothetical protein